MDAEGFQILSEFFLSTQHLDASVSLKTWWDDDKKLRFFITNAPPRKLATPSRRPNTKLSMCTPNMNRNKHSSPEVVRSKITTEDHPNISTIEHERDMSHESVFDETCVGDEHDSSVVKYGNKESI